MGVETRSGLVSGPITGKLLYKPEIGGPIPGELLYEREIGREPPLGNYTYRIAHQKAHG